jgi:GNAT superfamily N-acetyltransferase
MNRQVDYHSGVSRSISLRPMTVQDVPFGLKLSSLAGWNQTEADWAMLLEQSTAGCFLACYNGVETGTVTTISYQKQLNWVGMLLVAPEFQRRGIGIALLQAAIQAVKALGTICLDATPAGKPLYDRFGFQDLYRLERWLRPPASLGMQPVVRCRPLSQESLPTILAYDHPAFGANRAGILCALQRNAPSLALFAEFNHEVKGFCLGRTGHQYTQIGPVIADSLEIARDLLLSALQTCAHQPVILDNASHHPGWNQLLRDLGFMEQRPFIRMHLGEFSFPEHHARQYAIAGPEIG